MSGFGLAGVNNQVIFSTGNSDCNFYVSPEACPSSTTYDGVTNVQESVINMTANLAQKNGVFTPSNVYQMDIDDADLGASGVMLVPIQGGAWHLATIVSKDGRLWLLNQSDLATSLDMHQLSQGCWCGTSYFHGADGIGRVVSSAGNTVQTWQIQTSPSPVLIAEGSASVQQSAQDPGFFTTVSSHNSNLSTAIIWAVARITNTSPLMLYGFAAEPSNGKLKLLYAGAAGTWPNTGGNANLVPVVANGKVYVAAYQTLKIYGAGAAPSTAGAANVVAAVDLALPAGFSQRVTGRLLTIHGAKLTMRLRDMTTVTLDIAPAIEQERVANLALGTPYTALVSGAEIDGTLRVEALMRAKPGEAVWPADQR